MLKDSGYNASSFSSSIDQDPSHSEPLLVIFPLPGTLFSWLIPNPAFNLQPVLYHLQEFAQTHVYWVSDAIQPSHPLSPTSPLALNLSQYQSLFQWVGSLHQVAKVLELQLQSFQWIFRVDFFYWFDWFDLSVQGTLKSLLHHQISKASGAVITKMP